MVSYPYNTSLAVQPVLGARRYSVCMEFRVCFTTAKYEMISFHYVRHPMSLPVLLSFPQIPFDQSEPFKMIKSMLKYFQVF